MAYNVIKGNVEFSGPAQGTIEDMVDDHSDQTIGGTKTFSEMVTASVGVSASFFYGDGTGLTGLVEPAIVTYDGAATNRLIVGSYNSNVVSGAVGLSYDGSSLSVIGDVTASANVSASAFQGDGNSLTNIGPSSLNLGAGLRDLAGNLELDLDTASGLQVGVGGLKIYPSALGAAAALGDTDLFVVDQSGNKKATALQIYNYVDGKLSIPTVAGANTQIQFNDAGDLGASSNLTFDSATNLFSTVDGRFESITIDTTPGSGDSPLIVLDKGNASASYIEFKEEGTKFAEIKTTYNEQFNIRTTAISQGIYIQQGAGTLLQFLNGDTTFKTNDVTIEENLTVMGSTTTATRIHATTVQTSSYSIATTDEIVLMNNSSVATASLPSITSDLVGLTLTVKKTGTGALQVSGSDGIDTLSTIDITPQGGFMKIVAVDFGGSNYGWAIIAKSGSF